MWDPEEQSEAVHHACNRTHGTVDDLLSLIPGPNASKSKGDPFVTLSPRAAKGSRSLA